MMQQDSQHSEREAEDRVSEVSVRRPALEQQSAEADGREVLEVIPRQAKRESALSPCDQLLVTVDGVDGDFVREHVLQCVVDDALGS